MDPPGSRTPMLSAPTHASGAAGALLPGAEGPPRPEIDDHIVRPEGQYEVLRGRLLKTSPSLEEHADPHFGLDVVLGAHVRTGWRGATDLLTRTNAASDFASDTSVRREGVDPATGRRYLEELAFEVVNTRSAADVTAKAEDLTERGVRRVFAVFVRRGAVCEWRGGVWAPLGPDEVIADECFQPPVPVRALLDAAQVKDAVARALVAQGNPVLADVRRAAQARAALGAQARAVLAVLDARGVAVTDEARARVLACGDDAQLSRWLARAATATALDAVFAED